MAKVYGTNLPDILDGLFDGVTDDADTIFGFGGNDWIFGQGATTFCRVGTAPTSSMAATGSTPRITATRRWA